MFETVPVNDKVFLSLARCVFIAGFGLTFYFNRGTGVKNMAMPLHRTLCINFAHWTAESMEALECCRELTRNTLLWLGESENTRCLVTFWVELTKGVVQMGGHPGDDITSDSIGMPPGAKPLAHIKAMNYYMKKAFDRDLAVASLVLPALKTMDANLVGEVEGLFGDLLRMIDFEN